MLISERPVLLLLNRIRNFLITGLQRLLEAVHNCQRLE